MSSAPLESTAVNRARRKIALRLLPIVFTMYIVNYLDRANISFAHTPMIKELDFSEGVYGFGAGIFFVGYLVFEIPGALIVEHFGARRWMARILISWGFCSAAVGLVGTSPMVDAFLTRPNQFYLARFLLGLAEAGFYPGIIVYLTHWFSLHDRARAMSGLILGIPIALGLGAPISAAILQVQWFGYSGWRWLFILEGLPAVALGLFTWFYLTDRPKHAHWLEPGERDWIDNTLESERLAKQDTAHITIWQSFGQRNVILLALALFSANLNSYTFIFWLPSVIGRASGLSVTRSTLYSGLPYALAILATILVSYLSDRSGRRRFYAIVPMVVTGLALMASAVPGQPFWLAMVWLCLAGAGIYAGSPSFWVLSTVTLQSSAAAASIGMINAIANFSGFVAPSIVGALKTHGFSHAQIVPFVACGPLVASVLVALLRVPRPTELQPEEIKELGPASNLEVE
jgi:ACS family tartrate transporter-like MFS transporter